MNASPPIARRSFTAIKPDSARVQVTLLIGQPYEVTPEEWAVSVSMNGLHEHLGHIHGIDSWQVLQLAFEFIVQLLEHFVQDGGSLCWLGSDEQLQPVDLLPQRRLPNA